MHRSWLIEKLGPRRPWFAQVSRDGLRADAIAGLTNAAIVLPQGVAFAIIAGLPPQYGLFTAMIAPVIAAIWGSSMIMVSGPTTAISAVLFATLVQMAPPGTPAYVQLALALTVLVGLFQLVAGLFRLGGLIAFISHSVMVGFTAAAALLIGASQLSGALGIEAADGGGVLERLRHVAAGLGEASPLAMFIAAATLATIVIVQKIDRRLPAYLIALAVGAGLGQVTGAPDAGIAMFEPLAGLVPQPVVPSVTLDQISALLPGAASIAFIGLLEAISIGRAFALRRREAYDANQEIIGQGLSNSLGGFLQAYAGSGSFTRSALNVESGARSPLSAILSAGFLFVLLFLLAPFIDRIPVPAMAGIILYVGWRLISFAEIRHIVSHSRSEAVILLVTFLAGVTTELENSIFAGIIASLSVFLYRSARPHVAVMAPVLFRGRRQFRGVLYYNLEQCPQINVLRIEGPLFFASVEHVERELRRFERLFPGHRYRILQLKGLGRIDLSAATFLADEIERARRGGGDFHIVAAHVGLVRTLEHTGVCDILGRGNLHPTKTEAIAAAMHQIDDDICAGCKIRTYLECASKPAPEDTPPQRPPREIERLYSDGDLK